MLHIYDISSLRVNENPSSGIRVVPYGQTNVTKLTVAFHNIANAPKKLGRGGGGVVVVVVVEDCMVYRVQCSRLADPRLTPTTVESIRTRTYQVQKACRNRLRAGQVRNPGSIPGMDEEFHLSWKHPDRLWGPNNPLSTGSVSFIRGVKQSGREADHSRPPSAQLRMHGAIPLLPHTP